MLIRLTKGDVGISLSKLRTIWQAHSDQPLDYHFVDQQFENLFHKEQQLGSAVIALGTVGYQSIKVAIANPVKALKDE